MTRIPSGEEFVHEKLGDDFEKALSLYDTMRRVEVLIDDFLPDAILKGRTALDVGCGLGYFSEGLARRGAIVTACDLGAGLVDRTRRRVGCTALVADALHLADTFGGNKFDVVVSSECIEHTPQPEQAIGQMLAVLKPGGYLSISTPNVLWLPVVKLATKIGTRPFDGFENFSSWRSVRQAVEGAGGTVLQERGLHLFPFQLPLHPLSRWVDNHMQFLRGAMINICVLARKRG